MKTLAISKATKPLSEYTKKLKDELLILTSNGRPVVAIVSLKNVDLESLSLCTNPDFMEIIEISRKEFKKGKKLSLSEMQKEIARMDSDI
ncbi:MAG: hypothetical protein J7J77_02140 [Candidatus Cloacimonetes bacterium]|nr:hypothetical protein [Candidatus Cloacimonadota bacterium]